MVKSVLGVNYQGLRDWVIQRLSAIVITFYTIWLFAYLVFHPDLSFAAWHSLFSNGWTKIATILFIIALILHAWVGIWTIFTDYVKCFVVRSVLNSLVILLLCAFFFWGLLILWSV